MSDQVLPSFQQCSYLSDSSSSCPSPSKCDNDIDLGLNFCSTKQTARKSTNNMLNKFLGLEKNVKEYNILKTNKTKQTARKLTSPYLKEKVKKQLKHEVITGNNYDYD